MNYREVVAERIGITASERISMRGLESLRSSTELSHRIDDATRSLEIRLTAAFPAILKEMVLVDEKWPEDWWQAVRERWCPRWWLARHPVRYKSVSIEKPVYGPVCPHLPLDQGDTMAPHVRWIIGETE